MPVDSRFQRRSVRFKIERGVFDPEPECKNDRGFAQVGISAVELRAETVACTGRIDATRFIAVILRIDLVARKLQTVRNVAVNDDFLFNGVQPLFDI